MAVNVTRPQTSASTSAASATAAQPVLTRTAPVRRVEPSSAAGATPRKPSGYGLPCSKCKLYYPADLESCPTCHHTQRVSAAAPATRGNVSQAAPNPIPNSATVEQEREEFLRQFKTQMQQTHAEVTKAAKSMCAQSGHQSGDPTHAEVCKGCYDRLQERLDVFEAALHLDLKEATQIIYDAVWADSSDPAKTYENAASALLTELRKRAGMNTLVPFQPLSH
jgi:hypothetical protein